MDIRNCKNCGVMFQYVGSRVCPKCMKDIEDKLQEVKAYLEENNGASVMEVSENLDVSVNQIHRWVKEERLIFAPGVETGIVCQKCGMPIPTGTMCQKCANSLKNALNEAVRPTTQQRSSAVERAKGAKMHLSRYKNQD